MTSIYPSTTSSNNSSSSTSSANLLRISGMASGIDTDAVVKSMVSNYQAKIDKANQAKQTLQWKQDAYRDIIKGIKNLQDYFDPLSSKYILAGDSLNINKAASDDTSIVSATAGSNAKAGNYKVGVIQLAGQAKIQGDSMDSMVSVNPSNWTGGKLTFDINGSKVTLDGTLTKNTTSDLVSEINSKIATSSLNGKVTASYVNNNGNDYIKFTQSSSSASNSESIKLLDSDNSITDIKDIKINSGVSSTSKLTDSGLGFSTTGGNISFKLSNGTANYSVSLAVDANTTMQNLIDAVNSATNGSIAMNIDDTTGKISFQSKNYGSATNISVVDTSTGTNDMSKLGISMTTYTGAITNGTASSKLVDLGFSQGSMNFTLNGKNVSMSVDNTTTMQNLIDAVNNSGSGVTMGIDGTGKISLDSSSNIKITDTSTSNNIISTLGLKGANAVGTDAKVSITMPGESTGTVTTQSSNQFTVNGVSYNLLGVNETGKTSNVTVTANTDTVVTNIKNFITDYNTIISAINTKLTEKKDSGYPPLTDAQKESMSETQINAWESKAKVGILRNDDHLSDLMAQLRGIFSSPVYSSYNSSSPSSSVQISSSFGIYGSGAVGIDTSTDYTDGGKLVLRDETKLKSAIENNLEDFKKLFTGSSSITSLDPNQSYTGSEKYMEDGIFTRMSNILRDYVAAPGVGKDGTYTLSGSMNIFVNKQYDYSITGYSSQNTLPDQVYNQTLSISKYTTQLKDAQTRYYAKFTALETAMNTLNAQQSQLSSMLGTAQ